MERPSHRKAFWVGALAAAACAAMALATAAAAATSTTIDFESISGPSVFCSVPPPETLGSPLTIGDATFSGGAVLDAATFLPADPTSVYGTAQGASIAVDCPTYGYGNAISISFAQPVNDLSFLLLNGNTVTIEYTVTSPNGFTATYTLDPNAQSGQATVSLASTGITSVVIQPTVTPAIWDFFIDNVEFTAWPSTFAECMHGGWDGYQVFKNQGDCVSYVASAGRNQPANS